MYTGKVGVFQLSSDLSGVRPAFSTPYSVADADNLVWLGVNTRVLTTLNTYSASTPVTELLLGPKRMHTDANKAGVITVIRALLAMSRLEMRYALLDTGIPRVKISESGRVITTFRYMNQRVRCDRRAAGCDLLSGVDIRGRAIRLAYRHRSLNSTGT
jgi:hypothetical protein